MSDALLKHPSEEQAKYVLTAEDIRLLDLSLRGEGKIPYLQNIIRGDGKVRYLCREEKIGKSILQLAFIVTFGGEFVLLKHRGNRPTQLSVNSDEQTGEPKYSILTSALCEAAPQNEMGLLRIFHKKVPFNAFGNEKPDAVHFLGLVRNRVADKTDPQKVVTYYFYVYELAYRKKPFESLKKLNDMINAAETKDRREHFVLESPITEAAISLIHPNYHADAVAYQLLLNKRQKEHYSRSVSWVEAGNTSSIHDVGDAYFIIHAYADYDSHISPLTEKMKAEDVPYWTEEQHADSDIPWHLGNAIIEKLAKGVICLESPNSIINDNVIREIKLATELQRQDSRFEIIRLKTDDYTEKDENQLKIILQAKGVPADAATAYFGITMHHCTEPLQNYIVANLKKRHQQP